jgi:glucosylglycerate phosphorylase
MRDPIHERLVELYGPTAAIDTGRQLHHLLQQHSPPVTPIARPLTQRDAILITYADQVQAPHQAPLHALTDFCLHWLEDVVSAVHLLPFYPSSSDDGFSVVDYTAVDPDLGTWEDLAPLGARFDLMFDAVFNHMSAQSDWFQRFLQDDPAFRNFFVTVTGQPDLSQVVRPRALPLLTEFASATGPRQVWTTFSADQVDLNFKQPEVLLRTTEVLLRYVARGARFIRLDAIAYLWKEIGTSCIHLPQTHRVIQLWRAILNQIQPDVRLITETNVPHADNIAYFGDGTNEAQLVYNFALPPLVLHSLLRHNAAALTRWAQQLTLPSEQVTFFNFLASHDGIGVNPARGILTPTEIDRLVADVQHHGGFVSYKHNPDGTQSPYELNINFFDALSHPAANQPLHHTVQRFLLAHSILLTLRGVPGIYFHSLFGSRGDRPGAESSGIPRRINRQKLQRAAIESELRQTSSPRHQIFHRLQSMLQARRSHPAFHPTAPQTVFDLDPRLFVLRRGTPGSGAEVWCLHNVTDSIVSLSLPCDPADSSTAWIDLLSGTPINVSCPFQLDPFQAVWAARR